MKTNIYLILLNIDMSSRCSYEYLVPNGTNIVLTTKSLFFCKEIMHSSQSPVDILWKIYLSKPNFQFFYILNQKSLIPVLISLFLLQLAAIGYVNKLG